MGGRVALLTAAEIPGISAIVSDGGPIRLTAAINEEMKQKGIPCGFRQLLTWMIVVGASLRVKRNLFSRDPIKVGLKLKNIPILFIHAEKDPYTNLRDLQNLRTTIGENAKIWMIQGVGHRETDTLDYENYVERITAFFDAYMKL
jgi:pimeloyl-ACP methyl ester carboxylesterase